MELIVRIIEALAWPAATIWLGYLFRSEIRGLLGRVSRLKYKDLEATFEKQLEKAEADIKSALPPPQRKSISDEEPIYPAPLDEKYAQLLRIAEESPRAALLEAWIEVEVSIAEACERYGLRRGPRTNMSRAIAELISKGKYARYALSAFEDLRTLRNQAAHAPQFQPNASQIRRYIQIAIELSLTFRNPLDGV